MMVGKRSSVTTPPRYNIYRLIANNDENMHKYIEAHVLNIHMVVKTKYLFDYQKDSKIVRFAKHTGLL